jgi:hypothetical protein
MYPYGEAVRAALAYQAAEQLPNLVTAAMSSGTQWGLMEAGINPALAAAVGSWGHQKVVSLFLSLASSNLIYQHGGINAVKAAPRWAYCSAQAAFGRGASLAQGIRNSAQNLTETILQYVTEPSKQ